VLPIAKQGTIYFDFNFSANLTNHSFIVRDDKLDYVHRISRIGPKQSYTAKLPNLFQSRQEKKKKKEKLEN
jgi:hypothetical protein